MTVTIYHNPRCSKSRRTLELLHEHGADVTVVDYLNTPPTAEELDRILRMLGLEPRELMRQTEAPYQDQALYRTDLPRDFLISAMIQHPILIERPIVVANGRAALGRPPEQVLNIL